MRALAHLVWEEGIPDCTRCRHDPALRAEYGCGDEPALKAVCSVTCSEHGPDCPRRAIDEVRPRCSQGERHFYRCPRRAIELNGDPSLERAFHLFAHYDEHHVLPTVGGVMDQASSIVEAFAVIRSEKHKIERERAERERAEAARREAMAKKKGGRRGSLG